MKRRDLLRVATTTLLAACSTSVHPPPARTVGPHVALDPFAELEASVGGRAGVFAIDTASGKLLAHREDERVAMCSTFKWALVANILARVDRGEISLEERLQYNSSDLVDNSGTTSAHVAEGSLPIEALAQAAIVKSDNTATNLLLTKIDGPSGLTQFFRRLGDSVTRLDRTEPTLNTNEPGDPRDTTSPRAMVGLMQAVLCGDVLSRAGRERLLGWMRGCETGRERLRAGLPADWIVGDKTGTGDEGAVNDVAIALPPGRSPILIAAYLSGSTSSVASLYAAHAQIGRIVAARLGPTG